MKRKLMLVVLFASLLSFALPSGGEAQTLEMASRSGQRLSALNIKFTAFTEVARANASNGDGDRAPTLSIIGTAQYAGKDSEGQAVNSSGDTAMALILEIPAGKDALAPIDNSLATSCLQMAMLAMSNPSKYSLVIRTSAPKPTISLGTLKSRTVALAILGATTSCSLGSPDAELDLLSYFK